MAPEQVEGKEADARSDIWALGAVHLRDGRPERAPFAGDTPASVIGAILKDAPPPLSARQPLTPPLLDHVVQRCLAKDPDDRWQSAADVQHGLKWIGEGVDAIPKPKPAWKDRAVLLTATAVSLLAVAAMAPAWLSHRREAAPDVLQLSILPPRGTEFYGPPASVVAPQIAISPDGRELAFVAQPARGRPSLWLRSLQQARGENVAGHRGRNLSLLVAGQPLAGLLRARQAVDHRGCRWPTESAHRGGTRCARWRVGSGRNNCVLPSRARAAIAHFQLGRHARSSDGARCFS